MRKAKRWMGLAGGGLALAAVLTGIGSAPAEGATPLDATWDLKADLGSANPGPDSYGNPGVWSYWRGAQQSSASHEPLGYHLPNTCNSGQVDYWFASQGAEPWVASNLGPETNCGHVHPTNQAAVHPGSAQSQSVIIRWTSPIAGVVSVSGFVYDANPASYDGVQWSVDKNDALIATGQIDEGGSQNFSDGSGAAGLTSISVAVGDRLHFAVGPRGSYYGDASGVEFIVRAVPPATTTTAPTTTTTVAPTTTTTVAPTTTTTVAPTTTTVALRPLQRAMCARLMNQRAGVIQRGEASIARARTEQQRQRAIASTQRQIEANDRSLARTGCPAAPVWTPPANPTAVTAQTYTVQPGDSLWSIADRTLGDGARYRDIAAANGVVNPGLIYTGQVLALPTV